MYLKISYIFLSVRKNNDAENIPTKIADANPAIGNPKK